MVIKCGSAARGDHVAYGRRDPCCASSSIYHKAPFGKRTCARSPHRQRRPSLASWLPQPTPPSPSRYTSSLSSSSLVGGRLGLPCAPPLAHSFVGSLPPLCSSLDPPWPSPLSVPSSFPRRIMPPPPLPPSSSSWSHSSMNLMCASHGQGQSKSVSEAVSAVSIITSSLASVHSPLLQVCLPSFLLPINAALFASLRGRVASRG